MGWGRTDGGWGVEGTLENGGAESLTTVTFTEGGATALAGATLNSFTHEGGGEYTVDVTTTVVADGMVSTETGKVYWEFDIEGFTDDGTNTVLMILTLPTIMANASQMIVAAGVCDAGSAASAADWVGGGFAESSNNARVVFVDDNNDASGGNTTRVNGAQVHIHWHPSQAVDGGDLGAMEVHRPGTAGQITGNSNTATSGAVKGWLMVGCNAAMTNEVVSFRLQYVVRTTPS